MEWAKERFTSGVDNVRREEPKVNNFPPFFPFMRISITQDCAPEKKYLAFLAVILCLLTYVAVVANSIATCVTMIAMFSYGTRSDAIFLPMFLASFIHILLGTFGIFIFQFLPVYYACRGSNSLRYICAFITQALWVVYFLLMAIGIPHLGSSGLLTGLLHIPWVKQQWWLLIFNVLFGLVWAAFAIFSIVVLVLLVVHYRRDNSSVFEAKTQFFGMVARRRLTSSI